MVLEFCGEPKGNVQGNEAVAEADNNGGNYC